MTGVPWSKEMDDYALAEHLPDVHELMAVYNERYFRGLLGAVQLEWSNRMTQCAGICTLKRRQGGKTRGWQGVECDENNTFFL